MGGRLKLEVGRVSGKTPLFFFFLFHSRFVLVDVLEGGIEH